MNTKTYRLPTAFYDDHLFRDCGQTGRIVKRLSKNYIVELDARAFADLLSDAKLFLFNFAAGQFEGYSAIGMRSSAARVIEILKADPFSAEELAEASRIEDEEWEAGREAREAEAARWAADVAARRLEREAEALAHPVVRGEYRADTPRGTVIGIPSNENLKVGTVIIEPSRHSHLEVLELGELGRGGKVDVLLRNRFDNSEPFAARLELGMIR